MASTRLPGKALADINGIPLLGHLVERVQRCLCLDDVLICTTTNVSDDIITEYATSIDCKYFRGSEHNLLDRLINGIKSVEGAVGVVVFGDGPLIDPMIIDLGVRLFFENNTFDLVSNDLKTTYPPGMEVEIVRLEALEDAAGRCNDPHILEHGSLFIRKHGNLYNLHNFEATESVRRPDIELEVDTLEDLEVIRTILKHFNGRTNYSLSEIIQFVDKNPEVANINRGIPREWKQHRDE